MSAFDVAGFIVWGWLSITGWREYATTLPEDNKGFAILIMVPVTLAAVFCLARLLGAKL